MTKARTGGALLAVLLGGGWIMAGQWLRSNTLPEARETYELAKLADKHPIIARLVAPRDAVVAAERYARAYEDLDDSNVLTAPVHWWTLKGAAQDLRAALGTGTVPADAPPAAPAPGASPTPKSAPLPSPPRPTPGKAPLGLALPDWAPGDWVELYRVAAHVDEAAFANNDDHSGGGGAPDLSLVVGGASVWLTQDQFSVDRTLDAALALRPSQAGMTVVLVDRDALHDEPLFQWEGLTPHAAVGSTKGGSRIALYWRHCAPRAGLRLTSIVPDSQASLHGLKAGHIVVAFNGTRLSTLREFADARGDDVPGVLRYWDGHTYKSATIVKGKIGITYEEWP